MDHFDGNRKSGVVIMMHSKVLRSLIGLTNLIASFSPFILQFLFNSVLECLQTAAARQHKSVAFPAIGTGNLGFTKKEAACIMSEAVVEFAKTFGGKMDIYFVIFPSDYGTFQVVFQKCFQEFRVKLPCQLPYLICNILNNDYF